MGSYDYEDLLKESAKFRMVQSIPFYVRSAGDAYSKRQQTRKGNAVPGDARQIGATDE